MLGPLWLSYGRRIVAVGGPKRKATLSLLLVRANTLVPVEELIDELWGAQIPKSAPHNVRLYIANLRHLLRPLPGASVINRHGSGYQLTCDPDDLDVGRFRALVAAGRRAAADNDWGVALARLENGVGLWRGRALADVPVRSALSAWCAAVEVEWLGANEDLIEALLRTGAPDRAASRASELLAVDPMRERGYALLMRARYQTGDVAGALAAFASARRYMAEQLGVEPGVNLRQLQSAILSRDPGLPMAGAIGSRI
nr:AfsR/SARP family transcriptional regulator [Micromonospora sp. DSM 115978]